LLAASLIERDLVFFAYGNHEFHDDFKKFLALLDGHHDVTVAEIYKILALYCDRVNGSDIESRGFDATVFEFCAEQLEKRNKKD
jgi:hypothetical protein